MITRSFFVALAVLVPSSFGVAQIFHTANAHGAHSALPAVFQSRLADGGHQTTAEVFLPTSPSNAAFAVVDTATLLSTQGVTRHVYTFGPTGKRTSDLTQKNEKDAWRDSARAVMSWDAAGRNTFRLTENWLVDHWVGSERETITYDDGGLPTSRLREVWSDDHWVNSEHESRSYDAGGHLTLYRLDIWSGASWVTAEQSSASYDGSGRTTQCSWEQLVNGKPGSYVRYWYTYDSDGRLLSQVLGQRGYSAESTSRESYIYDTEGNRISMLTEVMSTGGWVNSKRESSAYDASGHLVSRLDEQWSGSTWIGRDRFLFTYDEEGNTLTDTHEQYSEGDWLFKYRHTYAYDEQKNVVTDLLEGWQYGRKLIAVLWVSTYDPGGRKLAASYNGIWSGQVVPRRDSIFTYDAGGRVLAQMYEERSGGQQVAGECYDFTYDMDGRLTSWLHRGWQNSNWMPLDITANMFSIPAIQVADGAGNWCGYTGAYGVTLTYRIITTGVENEGRGIPAVSSLLQNYPNPFNAGTVIGYRVQPARRTESSKAGAGTGVGVVRLAVYDLLGREVAVLVDEKKAPGNYEVQFNASGLASGIYFYRLTAEGFIQTRKMQLLK
jgi:hypothetical protein